MRINQGGVAEVRIVEGARFLGIDAAGAQLNETPLNFAQVVAALYGFDGADLSRLEVESANNPNLKVLLAQGAREVDVSGSGSDGAGNNNDRLSVEAITSVFNGTTWDRQRRNYILVLHALSAEMVTGNTTTTSFFTGLGIWIGIEVTAASGTSPTFNAALRSAHANSNKNNMESAGVLIAIAQTTGVSTREMQVGPGLTTTTTDTVRQFNSLTPQRGDVKWTIGGTTPSFTFILEVAFVGG